jgi:hypothetical protein
LGEATVFSDKQREIRWRNSFSLSKVEQNSKANSRICCGLKKIQGNSFFHLVVILELLTKSLELYSNTNAIQLLLSIELSTDRGVRHNSNSKEVHNGYHFTWSWFSNGILDNHLLCSLATLSCIATVTYLFPMVFLVSNEWQQWQNLLSILQSTVVCHAHKTHCPSPTIFVSHRLEVLSLPYLATSMANGGQMEQQGGWHSVLYPQMM